MKPQRLFISIFNEFAPALKQLSEITNSQYQQALRYCLKNFTIQFKNFSEAKFQI
jgi:hypothetical protein